MPFLRAVAVAALLSGPPAAVADTSLPGGQKAAGLIAGQIAEATTEVHQRPVSNIRLGDLPIVLEKTPLGEIKSRFGGEMKFTGDAGSAMDWLCYRLEGTRSGPPMLVWFLSDSEMSGDHREVTGVALELAQGSAPAACSTLRRELGIDFGIPTLGADRATLAGVFGSSKIDAAGLVTYQYDEPIPPTSDLSQLLTYKFEGGAATAVEISQETTD